MYVALSKRCPYEAKGGEDLLSSKCLGKRRGKSLSQSDPLLRIIGVYLI
jgi:hypothetical protein